MFVVFCCFFFFWFLANKQPFITKAHTWCLSWTCKISAPSKGNGVKPKTNYVSIGQNKSNKYFSKVGRIKSACAYI